MTQNLQDRWIEIKPEAVRKWANVVDTQAKAKAMFQDEHRKIQILRLSRASDELYEQIEKLYAPLEQDPPSRYVSEVARDLEKEARAFIANILKGASIEEVKLLQYQIYAERRAYFDASGALGAIHSMLGCHLSQMASEQRHREEERYLRALKKAALANGYKGAQGGWIYRLNEGKLQKAICQGWKEFASKFPSIAEEARKS